MLDHAPQCLTAGDACFIGRSAFIITSDPAITPIDDDTLFDGLGHDVLNLGGNSLVATVLT